MITKRNKKRTECVEASERRCCRGDSTGDRQYTVFNLASDSIAVDPDSDSIAINRTQADLPTRLAVEIQSLEEIWRLVERK